jgi:ADP-ribose pyrophosphatase
MEILDTRKLDHHRFLSLFRTAYRDRRGNEKNWVFASRCDPPKILTGEFSTPDAVVIAALHAERNALVVVEEFRVTLGGYQLGLPAGLVDSGETVEAAATRELKEETGLELVQIKSVSPPIYSSSGMTDESVSMVFCECRGVPSNTANEASEDIRVRFVGRSEAARICEDRRSKTDAKAWLVLNGFSMSGRLVA